jgi:ABC-type nickel/cobalt efflux system permease component RcnA
VGSLAPCPTAWAIFAATLSVGRLAVGVLLLVAFTIGLHITILAVGVLLVISKKYALRRTSIRLTYALPIISACVIVGLGSALLIRNLR